MATESWVYDGGDWRKVTTFWAYAGSWLEITEAWAYTGSLWKKVYEAVSCDTGTCIGILGTYHFHGNLGCSDCTSGNCALCVRGNWGVCTDPCHNVDGHLSTNGGSYLLSTNCSGKSCTFDGGCDCSAGGSYEFSCELIRRCATDASTYQGQLKIQRDSDSGIDCTMTESGSHTGNCEIA